MSGKKNYLESLNAMISLLDAYAGFLEQVIKIEEESGKEVLKNSLEKMPEAIEKITEKDPKLGNKIALWTIKVLAVSNALSKIQTSNLDAKKALVEDIHLISKELTEINEELVKMEG